MILLAYSIDEKYGQSTNSHDNHTPINTFTSSFFFPFYFTMELPAFPSFPSWFKGAISKESLKDITGDIFGESDDTTSHNIQCTTPRADPGAPSSPLWIEESAKKIAREASGNISSTTSYVDPGASSAFCAPGAPLSFPDSHSRLKIIIPEEKLNEIRGELDNITAYNNQTLLYLSNDRRLIMERIREVSTCTTNVPAVVTPPPAVPVFHAVPPPTFSSPPTYFAPPHMLHLHRYTLMRRHLLRLYLHLHAQG
jgi:hypothetical protein